MKKFLLISIIACAIHDFCYAQLKTPQLSPTQTITQNFGLSTIELSYSRPSVRGRKIFGDLEAYGKVWRTGANQATTLTFGDEVTIGGTKVPAGKYGLLTIPEKSNWTIILTRQLNVTGADAYKKDSDIVRVMAKPMTLKEPMETFTIQFAKIKPNSCELQIMWENTGISVPISTDVDSKVMAQINELMSSDKPPYAQAATYYLDNGKDLGKAKDWAQKAVDANPKSFNTVHLLARIQAKSGDKAAAATTAKKSLDLAKEAKNTTYIQLNEKLIADLK